MRARSLSLMLAACCSAASAVADCGQRFVREEALQQVNAARGAARQCGPRVMGPAAPVRWDAALHAAAATHSHDMASRHYFDHHSPDGRGPRERVAAQNYRWRSVGENIATGQRSVAEVMRTWIESPDHCENLMDPGFTEIGLACARPGAGTANYWTLVLARR